MRNFLMTLIMCFGIFSILQAQTLDVSTNNVGQGDLLIGFNSQLSSVQLSDLSLSPTVAYGITDDIFAGISVSGNSDDVDLGVHLRGYVTELGNNRCFGQVSYNTNTFNDTDDVRVGVGVTGTINNWLYVEPVLSYNFGDVDSYGLGIGFGVRL